MNRIKQTNTKPVMVQITARVVVPSDTITMMLIEPHPDSKKDPTWLGHVTIVNPVTGKETRIDLVFDDGNIAETWLHDLTDTINTTLVATTETEN